MLESILLLELRGKPGALLLLGHQLGCLIEGPREVAMPLSDHTPEEVLSACAALGVEVLRSRVVRENSVRSKA